MLCYLWAASDQSFALRSAVCACHCLARREDSATSNRNCLEGQLWAGTVARGWRGAEGRARCAVLCCAVLCCAVLCCVAQVPVVASNRIGTEVFEGSQITFHGGSFITDYTGGIIAQVQRGSCPRKGRTLLSHLECFELDILDGTNCIEVRLSHMPGCS
jgi:hypothetical protein